MLAHRLAISLLTLTALLIPAPAMGSDGLSLSRILIASAGMTDAVSGGNCGNASNQLRAASCELRKASNMARAGQLLGDALPLGRVLKSTTQRTAASTADGPLAALARRCRSGSHDACNALAILQ